MIISVQDLFDEPLFSQITDENCEIYLWWKARAGETFLSTFMEWVNDPLYDDFDTTSVLVSFWDKLEPSTREQMLNAVKGNPACCRMIYARVLDPVGISIDYLTTHGVSDGAGMDPAIRSRESLLKAKNKL